MMLKYWHFSVHIFLKIKAHFLIIGELIKKISRVKQLEVSIEIGIVTAVCPEWSMVFLCVPKNVQEGKKTGQSGCNL